MLFLKLKVPVLPKKKIVRSLHLKREADGHTYQIKREIPTQSHLFSFTTFLFNKIVNKFIETYR
jgi:hypothetical protein